MRSPIRRPVATFAAQLGAFNRAVAGGIESTTRGATHEALRRMQRRTPVDTGYARSRWLSSGSGLAYRITNDAEYIVALEFGHSRQAPSGMVRVTGMEWQAIVAAEARKAFARPQGGRAP